MTKREFMRGIMAACAMVAMPIISNDEDEFVNDVAEAIWKLSDETLNWKISYEGEPK